MQGLSGLSSDQVDRLLDAAPDPMVVVDGEGRVLLANRQVTAALGHPRHRVVGRDIRDLVPAWDTLLAGSTSLDAEGAVAGVAKHSSGRDVPVEVTIRSIRSGPEGLVGIFLRDISGRLALEQEADRMREELIANISHELRTPLTSMIGYLELLADLGPDELGPRARGLVEIIARSATRELRLVNDLLTVTFADDQLARMVVDLVDLGALAAQVVEEHQPLARGAGLVLSVAASEGVVVRGDTDHLARVIENLVTNSLKFSPPGGEIRVVVEADAGDLARLVVSDTGIGVSEAERARLFERMYRAPGAIERQAEGAGLGLSIVKAIVEAHSGSVGVESELGVGTTMRVVLPRVSER